MAVQDFLPAVEIGNIGQTVIWFVFAIAVAIVLCVFAWLIIMRMKFNRKIIILEDVEGSDNLEVVGRDRAMLVKVAKSGMEVLYLKKGKVYKGAYGKRMGKNTYYFAIGSDGYWYNITLGSLTEGMKSVNIKPTPVNMRYQNEALQELIKSRYDATSFLQKYGGVIAFTMLILIFGIMTWLLFDKFGDIASASQSAVNSATAVQEETRKIIGALDGLRSSGGFEKVENG